MLARISTLFPHSNNSIKRAFLQNNSIGVQPINLHPYNYKPWDNDFNKNVLDWDPDKIEFVWIKRSEFNGQKDWGKTHTGVGPYRHSPFQSHDYSRYVSNTNPEILSYIPFGIELEVNTKKSRHMEQFYCDYCNAYSDTGDYDSSECEGEFEHEDSTGAKGKMSSGDVQWMKTGSGIIHSEMPTMTEGKLHGFQLWINMPAILKMSKPNYIYIDSDEMQIHKDNDKKVKVIAGKFENAKELIKGHNIEPIYFDVELKKDKEFNYKLPLTHNSFVYLINGEIKIGEKKHDKVNASTLIILANGQKLNIKGITNSKFLLISGKPIGEPIARGGPFVMNTKEEILKAVQDYQNGTFVK